MSFSTSLERRDSAAIVTLQGDLDIATETPEFREWAWIDPEELPERIVPFKRETYRAVLEAFRGHLR